MDPAEFRERWPSIANIPCVGDLLATLTASQTTITDLRLHAANYVGAMVDDQNRLSRLEAIIREYRQQHDQCNADLDDDQPHCPCDTCALALDALGQL